jgi:hypothetical protein
MSGELTVDPDRIRAAANALKQVATEFTQSAKGFQSEVTGYGEPWVGDDIGILVGLANEACMEAAIGCFTSNAEDMGSDAARPIEMARNYEQAEQSNVTEVNRVREILG